MANAVLGTGLIDDAARLLRYVKELRGHRKGTSVVPRVLTHTVTFRCNARCVMCDSWRLPRQDELTLDEVDRIYAQLPRLDAVRLTGGEPFVRKDLPEIAALARERLRPRILHITTNAFLTERILEFVDAWPDRSPLHLLVSLDGPQEKHDEVRGVPRSWDRAIETLEGLVERREHKALKLAVNQTVLDGDGARQYRPLKAELDALGVPVHVVIAYRESATYSLERDRDLVAENGGEYETFGQITPAEISLLLDQVEQDLDSLPKAERLAKSYYVAGLRRRLLGETGPTGPSCVALHAHLRLFPTGDVPTCQNNSKVVGNLRDRSFTDVWESALAAEQRRWVKGCAGCWTECEILPSAVYTGELAAHALRRTAHPHRTSQLTRT